jgi:ribulose-phosphate 3-epimerase
MWSSTESEQENREAMLDHIGIAPSILSADMAKLGEEIDSIKTADYVHFDVMDGEFVPQLSFGHPVLKAVKKMTDVPIDVHLMVENPDETVASYLEAGANIVTFHVEAATHAHRIIQQIHTAQALAGVALNPGTSIYELDSLVDCADVILVMTVDPGFGGQSYLPSSADKIKAVRELCRKHHANPTVEVDGGINNDTAATVARAGARLLVAGSGVFKCPDRAKAIRQLKDTACLGLSEQA